MGDVDKMADVDKVVDVGKGADADKMGDVDKTVDVHKRVNMKRGVCQEAGHTAEDPGSSVRGLKEVCRWREQYTTWQEAVFKHCVNNKRGKS